MNCTISKCKILGVWNGACKGGVVNSEHFVLWTGWTISLKFVCYILASLFFKSKGEPLWNLYFNFKNFKKFQFQKFQKFFLSIQKLFSFLRKLKFKILDIQISWRHQMPKYKTRNMFYWIVKHSLLMKFGQFMSYYKRKLVPGLVVFAKNKGQLLLENEFFEAKFDQISLHTSSDSFL